MSLPSLLSHTFLSTPFNRWSVEKGGILFFFIRSKYLPCNYTSRSRLRGESRPFGLRLSWPKKNLPPFLSLHSFFILFLSLFLSPSLSFSPIFFNVFSFALFDSTNHRDDSFSPSPKDISSIYHLTFIFLSFSLFLLDFSELCYITPTPRPRGFSLISFLTSTSIFVLSNMTTYALYSMLLPYQFPFPPFHHSLHINFAKISRHSRFS